MDSKADEGKGGLRPVHPGRVSAGAIFVAMGVVMLLDRTETMGGYAWQTFPGFVLVALGVTGMIGNWRTCDGRRGSPLSGLWMILVGSWLIASSVHAFGLTYKNSWPLVLVAVGTLIVLGELFPRLRATRRQEKN